MSCLRLFTLAFWLLFASLASAQLSIPVPLSERGGREAQRNALSLEELDEKRAALAEKIDVARATVEADGSEANSAAAAEPSPDIELLKGLDSIYAQQQAVLARQKELESQKAEMQRRLDILEHNPEDAPERSFLALDGIRDALVGARSKLENASAATRISAESLEKARTSLAEKERQLRQAREQRDAARNDNRAAAAQRARQLKQEIELAVELVRLRDVQLAHDRLAEEAQQLRVTVLEKRIQTLERTTQFTRDDLNRVLAEIDQQEYEVRQAIEGAKLSLDYIERQFAEARNRLDQAGEDRPIRAEQFEAWRLGREKRQQQLALLNRQLQRLSEVRTSWTRRYQTATRLVPRDEMEAWASSTHDILSELKREAVIESQRIESLTGELARREARREPNRQELPAEQVSALADQRRHLRELIQIYQENMVKIEAVQGVHQKLLDEITEDSSHLSPAQWAAAIGGALNDGWNYELLVIDDRPITVRKLVTGMLVFFMGLMLSRWVSRLLVRRLLGRIRANKDLVAAVQMLIFYMLIITVTLFALRFVNVPLTAFTILGGAAAIGVGFGSQHVVNNFLSGLIMMAERPARLGERVVYSGYDGTVEDIGFRCMKIRTLTGHLVTVPNSNIINEPLENIGRRPYIRRMMNVTITYDTPRHKIQRAVELIREILDEPGISERIHPKVDGDDYPPRVHFSDYNSDSLNIQVLYWFSPPVYWDFLEHAEKVNFRIFEEFEKEQIEFAFPSQTLYLAGDNRRRLSIDNASGMRSERAA